MGRTAFTSRTSRCLWAFAATTLGVVLVGSCSSSHRASRATASTSTPTSSVRAKPTTTTLPATPYRVKPGDTLSEIAGRFHVSVAAIVARNHLANPDRVADGQTLLIPPRPPLALAVTPAAGPAGKTFMLRLVGAKPSEVITFEVRSPHGSFRGPPHTATVDGSVTTTYQTASSDSPGIYTVIAHGTAGTSVSARFPVLPPTTPVT